MYIPQDPNILLSFINMKLRDEFDSFDSLCDDLDIDKADVEKRLNDAGFFYDAVNNRFS